MTRIEVLESGIRAAMDELENMPCGGIGEDGPTLDEIDNHVDETGNVWGGDASLHTAQRAWRLLESGLNDAESESRL